MAGTLTIGTLSDGTNSTSSTNAIMGSAKAWVNFNGVTTVTIRASYNVSSVTRNSAGDYTVNFTNAFPDTGYAYTHGGSNVSGNGTVNGLSMIEVLNTGPVLTRTTTSFRFFSYNTTWNLNDGFSISLAFFR